LFRWIEDGQLDVANMVTRHYSLFQLQEALNDMMNGTNLKGVIVFEQETT
jgi:Zn-dependent alcohol dehydrogenase